MCQTGNGTTVTLAATSIVGRIIRMAEWTEEIAVIDDNDLSLVDGDHAKKCFGKVIDHEPWEFDAVFDADVIKALGTEGEIIVTFQPKAGQTNGATMTGNGALNKRGKGPFETNQRVEGGFAFTFTGGSGGIVEAVGT